MTTGRANVERELSWTEKKKKGVEINLFRYRIYNL